MNTWLPGQTATSVTNEFINPTGTTYPVLLNGDWLIPLYGGVGYEDYFIIDREGKVAYRVHTYNRSAIEAQLDIVLSSTGVSDEDFENQLPDKFSLKQNYPNPFNPSTIIEFNLNNTDQKTVSLKVYDLLGRHISTLVNAKLSAGNHSYEWNGKDVSGNQVTSGVYQYVLQVGNKKEVKKMLLIR
ncbi:T9SS type A sorting domain-containing protein [candidate division KSB1 bacterium]|nr:T9SS type A sorting domain-containing protein [candidate division KSB1 bacterium]